MLSPLKQRKLEWVTGQPKTVVELIPDGCSRLRVAEFPTAQMELISVRIFADIFLMIATFHCCGSSDSGRERNACRMLLAAR